LVLDGSTIKEQFLEFHLEDKVVFLEWSNVRQEGQHGEQVKEKMWMVYYRMKLNKWSSDS